MSIDTRRRDAPTHFIAIQITNDEIISKIKVMQESVRHQKLNPPWNGLEDTGIYSTAMVPLQKLHFTLNVMHLKEIEDIERSRVVLAEVGYLVHEEFQKNPIYLDIQGLGNFGSKVVFGRIKDDDSVFRLASLHDLLQAKFNEHLNLQIDPRPFTPHLTIANITRSRECFAQRISSFPPNMWCDFENTKFGTQRVMSIHLLEMGGGDPSTGCYISHGQYDLE